MEEQNFNPVIEAVVSIRHLAISASDNWTAMNKAGSIIQSNLKEAASLVKKYANLSTKDQWLSEFNKYMDNLGHLKVILNSAIDKIKSKNSVGISEGWEKHLQFSKNIASNLSDLETIGKSSLPENELEHWKSIWSEIYNSHDRIQNEASACGIQLKMIESYSPDEVDELTDTILKNIPPKYSKEEAHQYSDEYMKAYEAIKKEATQKKNLWDRFLDILAGGTQQTPAQRVMMQRWVDGEKGELH
ncbi:hypothetical protein [Winogradskyella sp.]|uniref:hypothetical protein n=1 Tax=Winogradskyella sp. TaxID=1883156 RepID=UPI00262EC2B7|nr:hypothetical protein [Winogradskyella sp.]